MANQIDLPLLAQQLRATGDPVALGLATSCDHHHTLSQTLDPNLYDLMLTFITPATHTITTTTDNDNHIVNTNPTDNTIPIATTHTTDSSYPIHINDNNDDNSSAYSEDFNNDNASIHIANTFPNDEQIERITRDMPSYLLEPAPTPTPLEIVTADTARVKSTTILARTLLSKPNGIPPKHRTNTTTPYMQRLKRTTRWLQARQARRISLTRYHRIKQTTATQNSTSAPTPAPTTTGPPSPPMTGLTTPNTTAPPSPPMTGLPTATHTNTSTNISPAQPLVYKPNYYETNTNTTTHSNNTRHTQGQLTTGPDNDHTHSIERVDNTPDPTPPPTPDLHQLSQLLHRTNNHTLAQCCEHAISQDETLNPNLHQTMLSKIAEFYAYQTTFGK